MIQNTIENNKIKSKKTCEFSQVFFYLQGFLKTVVVKTVALKVYNMV